jgi:hypothetical protein
MEKFWRAALGICGLSAVGSFVFYSLYKQYLSLPIFSQMTPGQTFVIMLVFLGLTFLALLVTLITYYATKKAPLANPDEAVAVLKERRESISSDLQKVVDELSEAGGKTARSLEVKAELLHLREQFSSLSDRHLAAVAANEALLAHELAARIHEILEQIEKLASTRSGEIGNDWYANLPRRYLEAPEEGQDPEYAAVARAVGKLSKTVGQLKSMSYPGAAPREIPGDLSELAFDSIDGSKGRG